MMKVSVLREIVNKMCMYKYSERSGMYKVGDIVLLREDVDSIYSGNLHKGDWYVVLGVMEYNGSQFISIKDDDRVAVWYLSSIFNPVILNGGKCAVKDSCCNPAGSDSQNLNSVPLPTFQVGQKVWDVVRGEGVVTYIEEDAEYPVVVEFDGEEEDYTADGKYREDHAFPSLYTYKPKIVKDEDAEDCFIATFKQGDLVQVKFVDSEEIHDTVFVVEKETKDAFYMKGNHFFLKSQISNIYSLCREEVELANTL